MNGAHSTSSHHLMQALESSGTRAATNTGSSSISRSETSLDPASPVMLWRYCFTKTFSLNLDCVHQMCSPILSDVQAVVLIMIMYHNNVYCLFQLSLRLLDRGLSYRTQLLHSYFKKQRTESSTHLKINYNNQMPLVAGVHWKDVSTKTSLQKWEGV